jgi:hypothetical protein
MLRTSILIGAAVATAGLPATSAAQGTAADYERASTVAERTEGLVLDLADTPHWISNTKFWYRKTVKGGAEFVLVDAASVQRRPAFDHDKIATVLGSATKHSYTATTLPFTTFTFVDGEGAIDVAVDGANWRCTVSPVGCARLGDAPQGGGRGQGLRGAGRGGSGRGGAPVDERGGRGNTSRQRFSAAATTAARGIARATLV